MANIYTFICIIEISTGSFSMGNAKLCAPAVLNSRVEPSVFNGVCVPILIYLITS
jgi:hypothetical protein